MHLADPQLGILGANGIVGAGIPIAVGAALAAKRQGAGARSSWPSSARARSTAAPSTRADPRRRLAGCRWSSSARTTATPSSPTERTLGRPGVRSSAPAAYGVAADRGRRQRRARGAEAGRAAGRRGALGVGARASSRRTPPGCAATTRATPSPTGPRPSSSAWAQRDPLARARSVLAEAGRDADADAASPRRPRAEMRRAVERRARGALPRPGRRCWRTSMAERAHPAPATSRRSTRRSPTRWSATTR